MEALKDIALPPGFGFHPTDVELISHYLRRKNQGLKVEFEVIPVLDIYKHEPWDLPACCQIPTRDSKWHFFTSRDRKYPNGSRSNRATEAGYWKSTGKDRNIRFHNRVIGTKKTLVFHEGRPPCGKRTDWIMHEYFMDEKERETIPGMKDTYVLCRVTKRNDFVVEGENVSAHAQEVDDCHKTVKDLYVSLQEEISPSGNTENLDAWISELFDPNFDGYIDLNVIEPKSEPQDLQTSFSTLIPMDDPLDFGFLPEKFIGILQDDFTGMPEINELLAVDHNSTPSLNQLNQFGTEDFKKEMPDLSKSTKFTGIQIQEGRGRPSFGTFQHHVKLQVQTSKMETRNSSSVSQTIKFAHVDHHISTNSKPRQPINLKVEKKKETRQNGIKELKAVVWSFLSWCMTDGMDCCFLSACIIIGTAALVIYFLFFDCLKFLGSFPALGF